VGFDRSRIKLNGILVISNFCCEIRFKFPAKITSSRYGRAVHPKYLGPKLGPKPNY